MLVPVYENIALDRVKNALWLIYDFDVAMDMIINPENYMKGE